ncbi:MAG: AMP-binding protein, partial [Simkaniaceae bacterium]|nr:AMP-binding protein [Simkaniaceae bacterium]
MKIIGFIAEKNRKTANFLFHIISRGDIAFPLSPRLPQKVIENLPIDQIEPVVDKPFSFTPRKGPALMLLSSGSTGNGKICTSTIANHLYSARGSNEILPLCPNDAWLCDLPLFHIAGIAILFRCYLAGARVIFPGEPIDEITHISYVPTQLFRETRIFPKLKAMLIGGAALPKALKTNRYPIMETYGSTEMCSQIATDYRGKGLEVLPYRQIKLDNDEILVRGQTLCEGQPLDNGWYRTGDLGKLENG